MTSNTINKSISILIFMGFLSFSTKPFEEMNTIKVRKIEDFEITGNENTNHWKAAKWIKLTQRKSEGGSYGTQVKIQYSDRGIYFLFLCEDSKITSTMKEDNLDLWTEDVVEIFLWTDVHYPLYFEYELSPMNYELPLLIPNMEGKFLGWIPWHYFGDRKVIHATGVAGGEKRSGASITSWTAEFFIPFELLSPLNNVPPQKGTQWRANMYRMDYDSGHSIWSWQETDKTFHEYEKFGTLLFD